MIIKDKEIVIVKMFAPKYIFVTCENQYRKIARMEM